MICLLFPADESQAAAKIKAPAVVRQVSASYRMTDKKKTASVTLGWNKIKKNVTGYQVYQKSGGKKWKLVRSAKKNKSSVRLTVVPGKTYQFKVRAVNKRKQGKKYVTKKGRFSQAVTLKIPGSSEDHSESEEDKSGMGLWNGDDWYYEFPPDDDSEDHFPYTLTTAFVFHNNDSCTKRPGDFFIVEVTQAGKQMQLIEGGITGDAPGHKKTSYKLVYRLTEKAPMKITLKDISGKVWFEDEQRFIFDE